MGQAARVRGARADLAGQRDIRIELRHRYADIGGRGVQTRLGAANVGAPARERRRQTHRHSRRHGRHLGRRGQFRLKRTRRFTKQIRQTVQRLCDLLIVLRQLRLRLCELRRGALHVQLAGESHFGLALRQPDNLALLIDKALRNLPQRLRAAQLHIGLRDLGFERHQRIVAAFQRRFGLRMGRFNRAAHAAEQIQFPRGIEANLPEIDRRGQLVEDVVGAVFHRSARAGSNSVDRRIWRAQLIDLVINACRFEKALGAQLFALVTAARAHIRQALRRGALLLGAGLDDAQHRFLQIEIAAGGALDQAIKRRVREAAPPARIGIRVHGRHRGNRDARCP